MRSALVIFLCFGKAFAQDYVAHWKTVGRELDVVNYQVQKSQDSLKGYVTIAGSTINPKKQRDSNVYSFILPEPSGFFRIKALMKSPFPPYIATVYTVPIKIKNTNVRISNTLLKTSGDSDNLSFNAQNEALVNHYSIERSVNNGKTWIICGVLTQKGKGNYMVNISRIGINRKYRLTAVYKNGIRNSPIIF